MTTMWFILLTVSLLFNVVAGMYLRWLLKTVATINQDIDNLSTMIIDFSNHTESVFELEMFYGDQTLKSLLEHSRSLIDNIKDIDLILNLKVEEEDENAGN